MMNTGFDPYMELLQHGSNINQLAIALNNQARTLEEQTRLLRHQSEVIQQLQFNDRKQKQLIDRHSQELLILHNEVQTLKNSP